MLKPLKCFLLTINLTLKSLCSMSHRKAGVVEDYFEDLSQTLSFWGLCLLSEDTNETGVTDKGIHQKKRGALCQPRANNKRGLGESFLKQESGIVQLQGEHIQYDRGTGEGDSWDPKNMTRLKSSDQEQHKDSADQFFLHPNICFLPQNNPSVQKWTSIQSFKHFTFL